MGALTLSIAQTVLIYVGIPAAVIIIVAGLILAGGSRRAKRYRPGRPYDFASVWFTAAPGSTGDAGARELTAGHAHAEVTGPAQAEMPVAVIVEGRTGGASDRW